MEPTQLNWIANFNWGIADDVLRDLYVRGKYRDVILPMTVLRRLGAVLEPTKQAVLDKAGITNQDQALRQAAGQAFYNASKFTLRDLKARAQGVGACHDRRAEGRYGAIQAVHGQRIVQAVADGYGVRADVHGRSSGIARCVLHWVSLFRVSVSVRPDRRGEAGWRDPASR